MAWKRPWTLHLDHPNQSFHAWKEDQRIFQVSSRANSRAIQELARRVIAVRYVDDVPPTHVFDINAAGHESSQNATREEADQFSFLPRKRENRSAWKG